MIDKIGLGSIAKSVAGGFISKTWNRLKGANIPSDSRIAGKRSQAKLSGRNSKKDWRVNLTIPQGSLLEGHFFNNNTLLYTCKFISFF